MQPSEIEEVDLGLKLADAHSLTMQLIVALGGSYRYKKNIITMLRELQFALEGLKSHMPTVRREPARRDGNVVVYDPYYPTREQGFVRTEISIQLTPREMVSGKTRLTADEIDAALGYLADIETCLDLCSGMVASLADQPSSSEANADIDRAFAFSHKAKELLTMIRPAMTR